MNLSNKIALIYFSRTVESEASNKSWTFNSTRAQRIAISRFLDRTTHFALNSSGFDIIHFDEKQQQGEYFGERLASAFAYAFEQGYERAISVGNDCLELDQVNWRKVEDELTEGRAVLGPTFRHGAYLIGLNKRDFNKEKFQKLRWQTEHILEDLENYLLGQCCLVSKLDTRHDINDLRDFEQVLRCSSLVAAVISTIKSLLAATHQSIYSLKQVYNTTFLSTQLALRGPPARI